jgi:hypothetical protein
MTLGVFRLRLLGPVLAFFSFGALAAGRTDQAIFLFATLIGIGLIVWLWASWHAHSPANQGIYAPVTYRFSAEQIEFESQDVFGEIAWGTIKRWRYLSEHYLLHVTGASFLAIPTTCVEPDERGELEDLFSARIAKGPRPRGR